MLPKRPPQSASSRHTLYGVVAVLLWSTTVALARSLTEQLGPLTAASSVYLTGGAFCLAYLCSSGSRVARVRQISRCYLLGCGTLFVVYMLALYLAIGRAADRHQALEVGLVNYLWPAFTLLLSLLLLDKRARPSLVPGTVLALLGVFLVLTQGASISWASFILNVRSNPTAHVLALVAATSWGLYSNLARRWGGSERGGAVTVFIPATGLALLILRLMSGERAAWQLRTAMEVLFMGSATTLGYLLWDSAMRRGDVILVAACSYFTPLFSVLVSSVYLRISAGRNVWLGCALIVIGSLLSWASVSDPP
jgi:drug/metabolite transporter (DMT)-like permease